MAEEVEEVEESEEEEKSSKKSNPLMIVIIVVVVILILLIGAVIFILLSGGEEEAQPEAVEEKAPTEKVEKKKKTATRKQAESFMDMGPMFPLEDFIVNLLSEGGKRYLKVNITLELSGEELAAELDTKQAAIRSIIIDILSEKSLEEVSTLKGKDKLRDQIVDELNARLSDGQINNVYFTKFVIQ
jgi:flagellar FliL protein